MSKQRDWADELADEFIRMQGNPHLAEIMAIRLRMAKAEGHSEGVESMAAAWQRSIDKMKVTPVSAN